MTILKINIPSRPAKNEIKRMRRNMGLNSTIGSHPRLLALDKAEQHEGVIVRAYTNKPATNANGTSVTESTGNSTTLANNTSTVDESRNTTVGAT